jgi:hypothetical protein
MNDFELKVWRLHPSGVRIEPAERTLKGTANADALKWCGPYAHANKAGFWVYPPLDIDITWRGGAEFEHTILTPYADAEVPVVRALKRPDDPMEMRVYTGSFTGRLKVDFGRVEPNIVQVWTGCIFQTPPGWALHARSPINLGLDRPFRIQEGILETDWMRYDIWLNLAFTQTGRTVSLRRDQEMPMAQLLPVRREGYEQRWTLSDRVLDRDDDEGNLAFLDWTDYNYKKYVRMAPEKDQGTYYKERSRNLRTSPTPDPAG